MVNVLGIDQSYSRIGMAVLSSNKGLVDHRSVDLSKLLTDTQKRLAVKEITNHWLLSYRIKLVAVERVRLFAGHYVSQQTAIRLASMTAYIVDACTCNYQHLRNGEVIHKPIPVVSAHTQSWKKTVLGSGKATKADAVKWVKETFDVEVNHDVADAICMCAYVLNKNRTGTLKKEQ